MPRGKAGNQADTINFFDGMNNVVESLFVKSPMTQF